MMHDVVFDVEAANVVSCVRLGVKEFCLALYELLPMIKPLLNDRAELRGRVSIWVLRPLDVDVVESNDIVDGIANLELAKTVGFVLSALLLFKARLQLGKRLLQRVGDLVVRHGDPNLGRPLVFVFRRTLENEA